MKRISHADAIKQIKEAEKITFLTGAGISTPSGIPDYRSLAGVYQGLEQPEYLLSRTCLLEEPEKFYAFVKNLYHLSAQPNVIHQVIADLEKSKEVRVVSQNIDGLHERAGSRNKIDFHGSLYHCFCQKCRQAVTVVDYLTSDYHKNCGGQVRPAIVLYEEGFSDQVIEEAVQAVAQAQLIVIAGTSFQVHPFCDLINYARLDAEILILNRTPISIARASSYFEGDAAELFEQLKER